MMMADLLPYPAMKDSGVESLGEVPEHWEVRRIKTLFRENDQRSGDGHGVPLAADLRPRLDESRHAGDGSAQPVAGSGRATGDGRPVPDPTDQDAPTKAESLGTARSA